MVNRPDRSATIGLDRDHCAARSAASRIPSVRADAERLPFCDRSFDAVLARGVLHHVDDVPAVLAEVGRMLRFGGRFVILDALPMADDEFAEMSRQLCACGVAPESRNGLDPDQLQRLAGSAGCSTIEARIAGRWTHATVPYVTREFTSPACVHTLTWP